MTGNIPFHEASLLKLNVDKALLQLKWQPTLSYDECVDMTGGWYRDVILGEADALATTLDHIGAYERLASERGLNWTL